jgi:hypothetical protein
MSLSEICANFITKKDSDHDKLLDKNILEFVTAPWGLGLGCGEVPPLYPAQRFILKAYYGLELDGSSNRDIIINDKFNEKELYRFNEVEYAHYLYGEGRINRAVIDKAYPNVAMVVGRRAGKTTLTACIIGYETYRLLNKYCPQEYYGIMPEDEISFTCVATSRDTASYLFNKVVGHLERSEFFRKYRTKSTKQWINLRTQRDIDRYGAHGRASISVRVAACSAKGLRGSNNMIVGLDEMAFFFIDEATGMKKAGAEGDHDDGAVYTAVTPSVAKFKSPVGDKPEGKIICISSPGSKSGKFFEEYERGFEQGCDDLLVVQAPTWEIDPSMSSTYLRSKYKENSISFRSEFGAEFSDRMFGWIEDPQVLRQCVVPELKYKQSSMLRVPHFMGIDLGMKNDGTAIGVCHWVKEVVNGVPVDRIELDAVDVRYLKLEIDQPNESLEPIVDSNGTGEERTRLPYFDPQEIVDWIEEFTKRFMIVKGLMDQYLGMAIMPLLMKKSLKQFEFRNFGESLNSYVYQNLLSLFIGSEVRLPEGDAVTINGRIEKDSELIRELLTLQAEQKSKYMVRVDHPDREGMHNDMSDAFARACLLAVEYRNKGFGSLTSPALSASERSNMGTLRMSRHSEIIKASLNRPSGAYMGKMQSRSMRTSLFR